MTNLLNGAKGNDTLVGSLGNDQMDGSDGNDTADYSAMAAGVVASLATNTVNKTGGGTDMLNKIENLTGSAFNDVLEGNGGDTDQLYAGDGNDTLDGGDGNDWLDGQNGDDYLFGGDGSDQLFGGWGKDTLDGSNGDDWLDGQGDNDLLAGNMGNDQLFGGDGNDTLLGGDGNDTLYGGFGNDILLGGAGSDRYNFGFGEGADVVQENDATPGNKDEIYFNNGIDPGYSLRPSQVWFRKVNGGNDLEISIIGRSDRVTVSGWYAGPARHVEEIHVGNSKLLDTNVDKLVQAMAAFNPPAAGQTVLPANLQSVLNPVIAANWT